MKTILRIFAEGLYKILKLAKDFKSPDEMMEMIHYNNAFLTRDIILDLIKKGEIVIEPFNEGQLGGVSYDCRVDPTEFRIPNRDNGVIRINNEVNYQHYTEVFNPKNGIIVLPPGGTIRARTLEVIKLPNNIMGAIDGRSRFARMDITAHVTASYIQPGTSNRQVLEVVNFGKNTYEIEVNSLRLCQIYFMRCSGFAPPHNGRYAAETGW